MFLSVKQLTYLSLFLGMLWAQFDFNIPKAGDNVTIQQKNGTVSASAEDATLTLHGNVNVTSGQGLELEARSIQINNKTKEIKLTGNVRIYQGPLTHTGSSALINEESQTIDTRNLQTRLVKVFIKADQIKSLKQGDDTIYYAKDAILTTHDSDKPHWWLSAKEMEVYPSGLIKLKRVTYKINGHPIFWLPFFYKGNSSDLGYTAQAGIDSIWGAFWLSRYGVHIFENQKWAQNEDGSPKVVAQAHLDILSSRGLGHGLTFLEQSAESRELSEWRFYGISDGNTTESRNGVDREPIDSYRNLLQAKQRFYFGDRQTLDFNITALSDRFYLEDFSPSTALHERELNNQITWSYETKRKLPGQLSLTVSPQINSFQTTITQLPELRYDQANRQLNLLGGTRWTGFSEIGHYQKKLADFIIEDLEEEQATASLARQNEIDSLLANREQKRVHTHQQLQYHFQPQPWLNSSITASVGALQYWDLRNAQSAENNEFTQLYSSAQIDLNTNFHRRNDDVYIDWLDIDGLVHNIQPYTQLSILGNQQYGEFTPDVDTRLINTRPLQLQAGQQDQYDSLDSWSILRTGIRQTLITRQNNKSHNWLSWNSYIDYLFDDPIADRTLSNWYNDLNFTPSTWTNLSWDSQLPVDSTGFTQSNFSWEFRPMRTVTLRFNHFLLNDHPFLNDADFLSTRTYIRLNDEIGVSTEHRYDRRSQDLIYQEYGYHRQMESWILSFNFFNRNNNQRSEFGISVGLQLKAFPQFRAPFRLGN